MENPQTPPSPSHLSPPRRGLNTSPAPLSPKKRPRSTSASPPKPLASAWKRMSPKRAIILPTHKGSTVLANRGSKRENSRRMNLTMAEAEDARCLEHIKCVEFSKNEFMNVALDSLHAAERCSRGIPNNTKLSWLDGLLELDTVLEHELWKAGECKFCYVEHFLSTNGRFPWMLGLKWNNEMRIYSRTQELVHQEQWSLMVRAST